MIFGPLSMKRTRSAREAAVRELAEALNERDYRRAREFFMEDVVVYSVRGGRTQGVDAWIEKDKAFRETSRAQIQLDEILHHHEELLVRGTLESPIPDVGGPTLWRVQFDGSLISEIEITRVNEGNR